MQACRRLGLPPPPPAVPAAAAVASLRSALDLDHASQHRWVQGNEVGGWRGWERNCVPMRVRCNRVLRAPEERIGEGPEVHTRGKSGGRWRRWEEGARKAVRLIGGRLNNRRSEGGGRGKGRAGSQGKLCGLAGRSRGKHLGHQSCNLIHHGWAGRAVQRATRGAADHRTLMVKECRVGSASSLGWPFERSSCTCQPAGVRGTGQQRCGGR